MTLSNSDCIALGSAIVSVVAIIAAPTIALYISGTLQRRADMRAAKEKLFSILIGLRHNYFNPDTVQALNRIDAVYVDDLAVREAWSQLIAIMNDGNSNNPAGYAIREMKRRDLLLEMVKSLGWQNKISTADLMRIYQPTFIVEEIQLHMIRRRVRKAELIKRANELNVDISEFLPVAPSQAPVLAGS